MVSERRELVSLIDQGAIPPDQVAKAVQAAGIKPSSLEWRIFIDRLLLWLGGLALVFSVLFFVAFNWADMGRWPRFGLVQVALVLTAGIAVWGSASRLGTQVALTAASLLVGGLLALFGQTYQTGADPWQLFFIWAVLILPWVLLARFEPLWLLWLGLLNLAIWLYFRAWGGALGGWLFSSEAVFGWLFAFNTLALAVGEWGVKRRGWRASVWLRRLMALGGGVSITLLMMTYLVDSSMSFVPVLVGYCLWLMALYGVYRHWRPDLLLIAGGCVSLISVVTLLLARLTLSQGDWEAGTLLMLALMVMAMGAGAVVWLKRLHTQEGQ